MKKINFFFPISMSTLALIVQGVPVLGITSQPLVTHLSRVVAAETDSAPTNTINREQVNAIALPKATSVTSSMMAQRGNIEALPESTESTVSSESSITSVDQLSNVQPTDWGFLALQSLIKRYSLYKNSPNDTYLANRTITRYEFAAELNAALTRVNELVAAGMAEKFSREDLATLQQLREEFAPELVKLQNSVDNLETRTAHLGANQFSPTTKLQAILAVGIGAGGFSRSRIVDPRGVEITNKAPSSTVFYRQTLDLNTSFSGTDQLKLRVEVGSDKGGDNAAGYLEPTFSSVINFSDRSATDNMFAITRANYTFSPFKNFAVTIGPIFTAQDYVDKNRYANLDVYDFSTELFVNNVILFPLPGLSPGVFAEWKPGNGPFSIRAVYNAMDGSNPQRGNNQNSLVGVAAFAKLLYPTPRGDGGLFGNPYQGIVELEYASKAFALRLQYSGGNVYNGRFNVFGANLELALNKKLGVFARYGYGGYDDTAFGNINPTYWMAGIALPDLFVSGALGGIAVGQPFIENRVGNATQTNIEAFYKFPVNDRMQITPLVQVIENPGNQSSNGTIITGTLRTVFSF